MQGCQPGLSYHLITSLCYSAVSVDLVALSAITAPLPTSSCCPHSHYTFLRPTLCPEVWEEEGEAAGCIFQGYSCLTVLMWKYLPDHQPPGTTVQEHRLFHKLWANRVHEKPTQVQMGLKAFQTCFPIVNLHIQFHIWYGKFQATDQFLRWFVCYCNKAKGKHGRRGCERKLPFALASLWTGVLHYGDLLSCHPLDNIKMVSIGWEMKC